MYNIYYSGEILHSNLTYQQGIEILASLSENHEYDSQLVEMIKEVIKEDIR